MVWLKQLLLVHLLVFTVHGNDISTEEPRYIASGSEESGEDGNRFDLMKINVDDTVAEVQRILEQDPTLPRLTRGEIMELLDNITKTDEENRRKKKLEQKSKYPSRESAQRAIMYVMPYSPKNYSSIEELYTKPPVIQIVTNPSDQITTYSPIRTRLPAHIQKTQLKQNSKVHVKVNAESGLQGTTTEKIQITKNISNLTPESQFPVPSIHIPHENIRIPFKPLKIPEVKVTTRSPDIILPTKFSKLSETKKPISFTTTDLPDITSTTKRTYVHRGSVRYPNHRYPDESAEIKPSPFALPSESALKVMDAPKLSEQTSEEGLRNQFVIGSVHDVSASQQHHVRRRPYPQTPYMRSTTESVFKVTPTPTKSTTEFDFVFLKDATTPKTSTEHFDFVHFKDDIDSFEDIGAEKTNNNQQIDFGLPDRYKQIIDNIDLDEAESKKKSNGKYSSQYQESDLFKKPISPPPLRDDVRNILASIGLFQASTTTTTPKPDLSIAAEALDPEMKKLLMTFGLIPNPSDDQNYKFPDDFPEPVKPTVSSESYTNFKPLPGLSGPTRKDMEPFLSRFGLIDNQRNQKAMEMKTNKNAEKPNKKPEPLTSIPDFDEDILPEGMKDILEDIGLSKKKRNRAIKYGSSSQKTKQPTKQHIFNPESTETSKEQLEKLELLINALKTLEKLNGTEISQSDLDALDLRQLKSLSESLSNSTLNDIPLDEQESGDLNPVSAEELQELVRNKSEFKRQNENDTKTSSESENTSDTNEEVETTTSNTASADELAESFPQVDDTRAAQQNTEEAAVPAPRRNGFYFLLDWNSFLEVGDDEKTKVNIRFSPKVGDPQRFINVNVP